MDVSGETLLETRNLVKYFPVFSRGILLKKQIGVVHAVDGVSLSIERGTTFALVGESGSGKTTLGNTILHIEWPTSGEVYFEGKNVSEVFRDGSKAEKLALRRSMQVIFQNPYASLDPRMTVYDIVSEPFAIHGNVEKTNMEDRVYELLNMVGLEEYHAERYPHEFSGGQRQRICIARALAVGPAFMVADEPVSSLDVSIRAQILNLLGDLQRNMGLTFLYISHDLSSVRQISQQVAVMYVGEIVEQAPTSELFDKALHPYTLALLSAVPIPDPERKATRIILLGETPSPISPPVGCRFNPRCPYAKDICSKTEPKLEEHMPHHLVACHFAGKLESKETAF
jgi:oligopeptide transport system ATP-binding protein